LSRSNQRLGFKLKKASFKVTIFHIPRVCVSVCVEDWSGETESLLDLGSGGVCSDTLGSDMGVREMHWVDVLRFFVLNLLGARD